MDDYTRRMQLLGDLLHLEEQGLIENGDNLIYDPLSGESNTPSHTVSAKGVDALTQYAAGMRSKGND